MTGAVRSNLGPLTTQFSIPSSCTAVHPDCTTCHVGWQAQICGTNPVNSQGLQDDPDCWPPRANFGVSTGDAFFGWGFYSPGVSCPAGYTTACTATGSADGGFPFQFPLLQSETAAGCCPTGYQCQYGAGGAQTCVTIITSGTFPTVSCSSQSSEDFGLLTIPGSATVTATATAGASIVTISLMTVYAPLIQLNWQSDIAPSSTTTTGGVSSLTSASATTSSSSSTSNISGPGNSGSSGGIGTGGAIGLGVGIGVAAVLLLGVFAWFWLRRRRQQKTTTQPSINDGSPYQEAPPYESGYEASKPVAEVDGHHQIPQMGGHHYAAEMGAPHYVAEMDGYHGAAELSSGR